MYQSTWGETSITGKTLDELIAMATAAVGRDGKDSDYVLNIARKLNAVGVEEPRSSRSRPLSGMLSSPMASLVLERLLLAIDSPRRGSSSGRPSARVGYLEKKPKPQQAES